MKFRQALKIHEKECQGFQYRVKTSNKAHSVWRRHTVFNTKEGRAYIVEVSRIMREVLGTDSYPEYFGRKGD